MHAFFLASKITFCSASHLTLSQNSGRLIRAVAASFAVLKPFRRTEESQWVSGDIAPKKVQL